MCERCSDLIPRYLEWLEYGDATHRPRSERTVGGREDVLLRFDRELPDGLGHASEDEIKALRKRYEKDWSDWTKVTYDSALRSFFGWAVREDKIGFDPMQRIGHPLPGDRTPHPCEDWELAVALTAPRYWRRAVMLGAYAGARCTEMCTVTTEDIIGDRLRIKGKGKKFRAVPIHPELAEELRGARPGPLLIGDRGGALSGRSLTMMQRQIWRELGLREEFTLHSLRHWYVTELFLTGATAPEVQYLAGWSSITMAMNYAKVFDDRVTAAVGRIRSMGQAVPASTRHGLPRAA